MNLFVIRERLFTFILPIIIAGAVLGYIIWLFGTRFLWDTASLTVQAPTGPAVTARIEVQSEIIHYDIPIPPFLHYTIGLLMGREVGKTYPLHFTLPWSQTVICTDICDFESIPAGNAVLTLSGTAGGNDNSSIQIVITPDTRGTIDLRPAVEITDVDVTSFAGTAIADAERNLIDGTLVTNNQYQSLAVFRGISGEILYDAASRQTIKIPDSLDSVSIARGSQDGAYLIFTQDGIYQFDRFGRTALEKIDTYSSGGIALQWLPETTEITLENRHRSLAGWWWILTKDEKTYLSDGARIIEVR